MTTRLSGCCYARKRMKFIGTIRIDRLWPAHRHQRLPIEQNDSRKLKSALPSVEEVEEERPLSLSKDDNTQNSCVHEDVITTLDSPFGELNRIYKDWFDNKGFSFESRNFNSQVLSGLQHDANGSWNKAILELVFHLPQEQYTLILNSPEKGSMRKHKLLQERMYAGWTDRLISASEFQNL